jgi:hypothetical protein
MGSLMGRDCSRSRMGGSIRGISGLECSMGMGCFLIALGRRCLMGVGIMTSQRCKRAGSLV